MKRHRPPVLHHSSSRPKLWLPSKTADQAAGDDEGAGVEEATNADRLAATEQQQQQASTSGGSVEEDDLDRLLDAYEAQAAQDLATSKAAAAAAAPKQPKQSATQRREAALEQPLAPDNKGFKLLAAMGYQPGRGLGREEGGRVEPLPLDLKQDRLGLGRVNKKAAARQSQRKREQQAAERMAEAQQQAEVSIHAGRQRTAEQFAARKVAGQLRKAQQVCESLDTAAGITTNHLWQPPPEGEGNAAAGPALPGSPRQGRQHPLDRTQAARPGRPRGQRRQEGPPGTGREPLGLFGLSGAFEDEELLEEADAFRRDMTGPGQQEEESREGRRYAGANARWAAAVGGTGGSGLLPAAAQPSEDRGSSGATAVGHSQQEASSDAEAAAAAAAAVWHELPVQQRLADVLAYLRGTYCYCLYCGCRFEDEPDMTEHCPGPAEADHE